MSQQGFAQIAKRTGGNITDAINKAPSIGSVLDSIRGRVKDKNEDYCKDINIEASDGFIRLGFGRPVDGIGMTPAGAIVIASALIKKAEECLNQKEKE